MSLGGRITADGTHLYLLTPAAGTGFMRATETTWFGRGGWFAVFGLLTLSPLRGRNLRLNLLWLLWIDVRLLIHLLNSILSLRGADVELRVRWEDVCHRDRLDTLARPASSSFLLAPVPSFPFLTHQQLQHIFSLLFFSYSNLPFWPFPTTSFQPRS
jgi:hypothetical protein